MSSGNLRAPFLCLGVRRGRMRQEGLLGGRVRSGQKAAVEDQRLPGHEGSAVGAHPEDGFRNFHRPTEAPDGMETEGELPGFWGAEEAFAHWRLDDGRTDSIDTNAFGCRFKSGAFREADDAVLCGAVGGGSSRSDETRDGRHVDDGSARALLQHLLNFVLQAEPDTLEVDGEGAVKVFLRLFSNRNAVAFNAGVVEANVEAAEFLDGLLDKSLDVGGFRNVGWNEDALAARAANEVDGLLAFGLAAAGDDDSGSFFREKHRGVAANAGGAPSDDGDLVLKFLGHRFSSWLACANCGQQTEGEFRPLPKRCQNKTARAGSSRHRLSSRP